MAYTKTTWVDEILAGTELFNIKQSDDTPIESDVKIELATAITTAGTAIDAAKMNNIESGIEALATGAARSVKGVAGGAAGDVADIAAGVDGHVLRRSGTGIGFGTILAAGIADGAVTPAKSSFLKNALSTLEVYFFHSLLLNTTADVVPSGWSWARQGTGIFRVTHNLATTEYMVLATINSSRDAVVNVEKWSNYFDIFTRYVAGGSAGSLGEYFTVSALILKM